MLIAQLLLPTTINKSNKKCFPSTPFDLQSLFIIFQEIPPLPCLMTCIESGVLETFHIAEEQFFSAIRKILLEKYKLHFTSGCTGEGYPVFEELLPKGGIHTQGFGLDKGIITIGVWIESRFGASW